MMHREVKLDTARTLGGLVVLVLGTLFYLISRPPGSVCLIPESFSIFDQTYLSFGALGQNMPTFAHSLALTLITAGVISCRTTGCAVVVSLGWFLVDTVFEFGQHPNISERLVASIPPWFNKMPILAHARGHFVHGTFDVWDLVSIAVGAAIAFIILQITKRRITS